MWTCGCILGYQARKGLHTGTVKIDPHEFIILNSYVKVICLSYIFIDFKKTPFRYVFSIAINVFL